MGEYAPFLATGDYRFEKRGISKNQLENNITVFNTHISEIEPINENQVECINTYMKPHLNDIYNRVIFAGDFNFFPDKNNNREIKNMQEVLSDPTYENEEFISRPDRIYYKGLVLKEVKVLKDNLSDHHGLMAEFYN